MATFVLYSAFLLLFALKPYSVQLHPVSVLTHPKDDFIRFIVSDQPLHAPLVFPSTPFNALTVRLDLDMLHGAARMLGTCTGTLVGVDKILTAAHCCGETVFSVTIGQIAPPSSPYGMQLPFTWYNETYPMPRCVPNPAYADGYPEYDVAVLHLPHPWPNCTNSTVDLLTDHSLSGERIVHFGYGVEQPSGRGLAGALMAMESLELDSWIARSHGGYALVTHSPNHTLCSADSGGPAAVHRDGKWLLVGVNSGGFPISADGVQRNRTRDGIYCKPGDLNVVARVADNIEFIQQQVPDIRIIPGNDCLSARFLKRLQAYTMHILTGIQACLYSFIHPFVAAVQWSLNHPGQFLLICACNVCIISVLVCACADLFHTR